MLETHFFDRRAPGSACVIDQDVDPPESRHRRIHDSLNIGRVLDITTEGQRLDPKLPQLLSGFFAAIFLPRAEHQVGAHFGQPFRHLASQSNGSSGDNGYTPGEIEKLSDIHFRPKDPLR